MGVLKIPYIMGALNQTGDSTIEQDKKQVLAGMLVWAVLSLILYYKDLMVLGTSPAFFWLLFIRISFALLSGVIGWVLMAYVNQRPVLNLLILIWGGLAVLVGIVISTSKPLPPGSGYLVDLVAIFSFYFFIPHNLLLRIIPPLLFTAFDICVVSFHPQVYSRQEVSQVMFSFTITNVIGIILSIYALSRQNKAELARLDEQRVRAELVRLATTDSLTGACNRRRLIEIAGESFYRFHRYRRPFSMLMMDLDGFKQVNDTFGHQQGDQVLVEFVRMLTTEKREVDALGRMGGDEFCLVLPETRLNEAAVMGERILRRCAGLTINHNTAISMTVSVSIGISEVQAQDQSVDQLISRADTALYSAKNAGKNQLVVK